MTIMTKLFTEQCEMKDVCTDSSPLAAANALVCHKCGNAYTVPVGDEFIYGCEG